MKLHRILLAAPAVVAMAACATTQAPATAELASSQSAQELPRFECVQSTGSRIQRPGKCNPVSGRSFSQEELQSTGAFTLSEALKLLDPSIR